MKKYIVTVNGNPFEVEIEEAIGGNHVSEENYKDVIQEKELVTSAKSNRFSSTDEKTIKAPMPGSIVDVRISPGQKFKKGDILFILEAMKMENEIMAGEDGTVLSVEVSKGDTVNTDDVLVTFA